MKTVQTTERNFFYSAKEHIYQKQLNEMQLEATPFSLGRLKSGQLFTQSTQKGGLPIGPYDDFILVATGTVEELLHG